MTRTLDEAIVQYQEKAEYFKTTTNVAYALELKQIAEWLEELKAYKKNSNTCPMCDTYCSYLAEEFENGFNKAIDDFADKLKQDVMTITFGLRICDIDRIAEQLKEKESD